jgi:peptidoglycan/xylan/chitin deacetylase (PgdA/CDA1 family)
LDKEIIKNRKILEDLVGQPCYFFAYPNGGPKDFCHSHRIRLKELGYKMAFSLTQHRWNPQSDPMAIPRINVNPEDSLKSLMFRCSGMSRIVSNSRDILKKAMKISCS